MDLLDLLLMALVGAFWGCTNPILRKGASEAKNSAQPSNGESRKPAEDSGSLVQVLRKSAMVFLNIRVWLPYALNQFGSVLFYVVLSRSDLMLAVPICNGLSLVCSIVTSFALGETVDRPVRAILGSVLVMTGVGICVQSREEATDTCPSSDQAIQ